MTTSQVPDRREIATYFYTPEEVATMLNIHVNSVYRLIKNNDLAAIRVGNQSLRIPTGSFEYLVRNALPPVS